MGNETEDSLAKKGVNNTDATLLKLKETRISRKQEVEFTFLYTIYIHNICNFQTSRNCSLMLNLKIYLVTNNNIYEIDLY